MKSLQKEIPLLILSAILIVLALLFNYSPIAILVSLFLAALAFKNPYFGFILLIIIVPLRTFFIALNPGFKIIADLIIFALLFKVFYLNKSNLKSLFKFQIFELAFLGYLAIGAISALLSDVPLIPIIFQIRAYLLFYLVYYIVKRLHFSQTYQITLAWVTIITATAIALHGFVEKIFDRTILMPEAWTQWNLAATNHVRVYGLIKGPNELALYLLIAFLVSLYLLNHSTKKETYVLYSGLSIIGATFLLTYSRGAFLALGVFALGYLIIYRSFKKFLPIMLIAVASAVLFIIVNFASDYYIEYKNNLNTEFVEEVEDPGSSNAKHIGSERFKEAFSEDTIGLSATDGRIYYVGKAIEVFKDYPVIGSGFATFGGAATLAYSSPIYEYYDIQFNFYSDNQYILSLAETGALGVLILTIFIFSLALIPFKLKKLGESALSIGLFFFFVTTMVGGLVYNILEIDSFMMYYFILLGIAQQRIEHQKSSL